MQLEIQVDIVVEAKDTNNALTILNAVLSAAELTIKTWNFVDTFDAPDEIAS